MVLRNNKVSINNTPKSPPRRSLWDSRRSSFQTTVLLFLTTLILSLSWSPASAAIVVTQQERNCLKQTGELFENNNELIAARHNYAVSMQTQMTSSMTMTAVYPDDKLKDYENMCTSNKGKLHVIKIDFFDCKLGNVQKDVELTLKNFANCLADTDDCAAFDQENLLEEAWEEMGLHCETEEAPSSSSSSSSSSSTNTNEDNNNNNNDNRPPMDDDLAREEEKAAAGGTEELDKTEKGAEYIPKEQAGKKKKSGGSRFFSFLVVVGMIGAAAYVVQNRRLNGRRLPWGGITTSRFQGHGGGNTGFVSHYNLLSSADEELNFGAGDHELQLSSTLTA
mmetsp:Transcript_3901/g.6911  ORF Transcript_3901/g.6911 Transcript_3901/m.6911 type:complete len:336 (+) Transcript_3901:45-1052(+)